MQLIVGLGNPGEKYKKTRHNIGFILLDDLAEQLSVDFKNNSEFNAEIAEQKIDGDKIVLCKPQTFMNNSGETVSKIANYYKIDPENILVIHDEIDLPFSEIKEAFNSGSAGHKGVQSIIDYLGTKEFRRLRFGIRNEQNQLPTEVFVLKDFSKDELDFIENFQLRDHLNDIDF